MGITKVQACNIIRSAAGLNPISTVEQDKTVKRILDLTIIEISPGSHAYNTNKTDLEPNTDGKISVSEFISFELPTPYENLVSKDGFLWDSETEDYFNQSVLGALVTSEPQWDNIPLCWQYAAAYRAACNFLLQYKGYTNELQYWEKKAFEALCGAEAQDPANMGKITGADERLGNFGSF